MSNILYYSNHCEYCRNLLNELARSSVKNELHFLCIDKRVTRNGGRYIQLENGSEIAIPPNINKVPSLLMQNRGNMVIEGNKVRAHLMQKINQVNNQATNNNGEPASFSLGDFGSVVSDNYSFLDQSPDELTAKGNGGMRQMHNYATVNHSDNLETPPDNYKADTIGNSVGAMGGNTLDKLIAQRDRDVPRQQMRM